jgi:hypothetical protein
MDWSNAPFFFTISGLIWSFGPSLYEHLREKVRAEVTAEIVGGSHASHRDIEAIRRGNVPTVSEKEMEEAARRMSEREIREIYERTLDQRIRAVNAELSKNSEQLYKIMEKTLVSSVPETASLPQRPAPLKPVYFQPDWWGKPARRVKKKC